MRSVLPPGSFIALEVAAGQSIRIVDLYGQQVADFISFNGSNLKERLAMYPSRAINRTWKLTKGHILYSNLSRPLWTIEEDTVGENYSVREGAAAEFLWRRAKTRLEPREGATMEGTSPLVDTVCPRS